jgi:hypothetical protein
VHRTWDIFWWIKQKGLRFSQALGIFPAFTWIGLKNQTGTMILL